MTRRVWKAELVVGQDRPVMMPEGSTLVHVQAPAGSFVTVEVWFAVDDEKPLEDRRFEIVGTGHPIMDDLEYRGTTTAEGGLVWHVYERIVT